MKTFSIACVLMLLSAPILCHGQISGNIGFNSQAGRSRADSRERGMRGLSEGEKPPTATGSFVEAHVLMNVKADEYVAVFALLREGETVAECAKKMDDIVKTFSDELKKVGVPERDIYVDFITHNRIYGYQV